MRLESRRPAGSGGDPGHGLKVYRPRDRTSILCPDKVSNSRGCAVPESRSTVCSSRRSPRSRQPRPAVLPGRDPSAGADRGRRAAGGRPPRERGGARRPARCVPAHHAEGHRVPRRAWHAGAPPRRRHPDRAPEGAPAGGADQPLRRSGEDRPGTGTEVRSLVVGPATARMAERGHPDGHVGHHGSSGCATRATSRWRSCTTRCRWTSWRCRAEDLEQRGLYEMLRAAGHVPRMATQVVGARAANAAEARVLGESRGAPLLTMSRTAWDESGRGRRVRRATSTARAATRSSWA